MKAPLRADAVIVGAGIVGTALAYFLALAGVEAVLVERGSVASGTSGSGEGNLLLSDKEPGAELEIAKRGIALWSELAEALGDFEYEPKGGMIVAYDDAELRELQSRAHMLQEHGIDAQVLDRDASCEIEPHLTRDCAGSLYVPGDAQVQPMYACRELLEQALTHGAQPQFQTEALSVETDERGEVCALATSAGTIQTRTIILACGVWTPLLCAKLGVEMPITPRKGHIVVTEPLPLRVRHKVYEANYGATVNSGEAVLQISAVVESTKSGTLLLGSSRQMIGFDWQIDPEIVCEISRRAVRLFPSLARANAMRAYTGLRPFVPDHLPLIGEIAAIPGLYVNAGHEGAGIGLGPISAKLLAERIVNGKPSMDLSPFDPSRFAGGKHEVMHAV